MFGNATGFNFGNHWVRQNDAEEAAKRQAAIEAYQAGCGNGAFYINQTGERSFIETPGGNWWSPSSVNLPPYTSAAFYRDGSVYISQTKPECAS